MTRLKCPCVPLVLALGLPSCGAPPVATMGPSQERPQDLPLDGSQEQREARPQARPTAAEILAEYPLYRLATLDPVIVDSRLFMLCRPWSRLEFATTRGSEEPHAGCAIQVYMNDAAYDSFRKERASFPEGAVIVKEKLRLADQRTAFKPRPSAVAGMMKRAPGFDTAHGDWEYFYAEDAAPIESGRIASCLQCHSRASDRDHVFGTWRPPEEDKAPPQGR